MTTANYYARRKQRKKQEFDEALVMSLVDAERSLQPRLGGRKVFELIKPELDRTGVKLGRDRMFDLLRANNALVKRKKGRPKTTNSRHSLPVCKNLIRDFVPDAPN